MYSFVYVNYVKYSELGVLSAESCHGKMFGKFKIIYCADFALYFLHLLCADIVFSLCIVQRSGYRTNNC